MHAITHEVQSKPLAPRAAKPDVPALLSALETLGVSCTTIANTLHVTTASVSHWRGGSVQMSPRSRAGLVSMLGAARKAAAQMLNRRGHTSDEKAELQRRIAVADAALAEEAERCRRIELAARILRGESV